MTSWRIALKCSILFGLLIFASTSLFPSLASAYHVEVAGRLLDAPGGASSALASRRLAGAAAHLEAALRWQEDNASAWRMLGRLAALQGNLLQAAQALNRYTALRPDNPAGWRELAAAYGVMTAELEGAESRDLLPALALQVNSGQEEARQSAALPTWEMPVAPDLLTRPLSTLTEPVLIIDPGSQVELEVSVPPTATMLFFWIGVDPAGWSTLRNGLTYSLAANGDEALTRHLTVAEARQGWWPITANLAPSAGHTIALTLGVSGDGSSAARAGWAGAQLLAPGAVAYVALAPREARLGAWRAGGFTSSNLVAAGDAARQDGRIDAAMDWYEQALALEPGSGLAWYSAAALYQELILADPDRLDTIPHAFEEYAAWNGGNRLVNGGFEESTLGWSCYNPSAANAVFDTVSSPSCEGRFSAIIWGQSDDYHGGWWQRLSLDEGHRYRYSADLRIEHSQGLEVRVLYWESYAAGAPHGQYAQVLSQDTDWTLVQVDFQAPASEQGVVLYPALVTGQGRVWIDDVRLIDLGAVRPGGSD